ncbi:MAG: hypothetical protein IBX52_09360 [Bacterioplanes sp.]|nr:hypothetical protein [Bacterioplanes sp.]
MPFLFVIFCLVVVAFPAHASQVNPSKSMTFDYQGDRLREYWPLLARGTHLPFPDQTEYERLLERYPTLAHTLVQQAQSADAHPALQAYAQGNAEPLLLALQQVWRLHFEGDFLPAYELGMQLGIAGSIPGLYARLMHTALVETDQDEKLRIFREVAQQSEALLPLVPDYAFAQFGLTYAHARTLELLSTSAATNSGLVSRARDTLQDLQTRYPNNMMYPATLGGIYAGVVERVGSWVGRMTYGATESRAIDAFELALSLEDQLPVVYKEFAQALLRLDAIKYNKRIQQLLHQCIELTVYSAEEALNQQACHSMLESLSR